VFARFRDVNPLPLATIFETDIEDGNLALSRVPLVSNEASVVLPPPPPVIPVR
jgi:hypothetical protein